jgi:hypothetical protein
MDWPRFKTVGNDPKRYLGNGAKSNELYTRSAAREICGILTANGYQLVGLEGFIESEDGRHESRMDTCWARSLTATTFEEAEIINLQGICSIDQDPAEINAYMITAISISQ